MSIHRHVMIALLIAGAAFGQGETEPTSPIVGTWKGTLSVGSGLELRLVVHVSVDEKTGALVASVDSVDQGAYGIAVDKVTFEKRRLGLSLANIGARYAGTLDESDRRIDGIWTQGGDMELDLEKTEEDTRPKRPQEPKAPFPYRVDEVKFSHTNTADRSVVELAGTLTRPTGEGPYPAVVLVSGSGPQDRDESLMGHRPFLVLADHLTRQGIAVLRYDDRGVGKSTGDFAKATTADFAEDALAAVRFLKTQSGIANEKVGICGHSEGGLVAPMAAVKSKDVAFIVMLAGPGVSGKEILRRQTALISRAQGLGEKRIEGIVEDAMAVYEVLVQTTDRAELEKKLLPIFERSIGRASAAERAALPEGGAQAVMEQQLMQLDTPWFRFFIEYDPGADLEKLEVPVLSLTGEKDLQVDPIQNQPVIAARLAKGGHRDWSVVTLPGLNHLFQNCETGALAEYALIEETFAPVALETVSNWIRMRFLR